MSAHEGEHICGQEGHWAIDERLRIETLCKFPFLAKSPTFQLWAAFLVRPAAAPASADALREFTVRSTVHPDLIPDDRYLSQPIDY